MPGSTSPRNYPYPLDADPIDVAGDIENLAEAINDDIEASLLYRAYANPAARDSDWPSAPDGARAYIVSLGYITQKRGSVWERGQPGQRIAGTNFVAGATSSTSWIGVASGSFVADQNHWYEVAGYVVGSNGGAADQIGVRVVIDGNNVTDAAMGLGNTPSSAIATIPLSSEYKHTAAAASVAWSVQFVTGFGTGSISIPRGRVIFRDNGWAA